MKTEGNSRLVMITDFEYLPLFFIVRCSEEAAIGGFYRYLSMQEKLPVANSMYIQLVNMHKKVHQTCATSRNRHSYIDKIEWLYNNVITLIKHLIKDKIKE